MRPMLIALSFACRSVRRFSPASHVFRLGTRRLSALQADTKFEGYSSQVAFCFPGQGAQYVGMCKDVVEEVPAARALFDKASAILGYDLLQVCVEGPKAKLDTTAVSQPAIFVASMCAVEKLRSAAAAAAADATIEGRDDDGEGGGSSSAAVVAMGDDNNHQLEATVAMGLSLGEYSALCYAGAISFEDGVKITKARGEAMQAASDLVDSGMVSVIGVSQEKVVELCEAASAKSGKSIRLANVLCDGNYAVSGAKEACDVVREMAKPDFGARMTMKLAVAGAFHTEFMNPAVERLEKVLDGVEIREPRIPVVSNVDAVAHSDPAVIKKLLLAQVTSPVQWEKTMRGMLDNGFERGVEIGPGKVIAGILKRVDKKAAITNIEV